SVHVLQAQDASKIMEDYKTYTKATREVVYLHLNKSTYLKGESIAFTAYVLNKKSKTPSFLTTNLYVSIEDENNTVIDQRLLKVNNGVASHSIETDSLFASGLYKIKAYTNWMLNFDEKNYFSESIKIIDTDAKEEVKTKPPTPKIDAQFLPESGHLLSDVINVVGVVIKNQHGFGIPHAKGEVLDESNTVITTFETNQFGIGKFELLPELGDHYSVKVKHNANDYAFNIEEPTEDKGIIIALTSTESQVLMSFITNFKTLDLIKGKLYTLMIHNGDAFEIMNFSFTDRTILTKTIDLSNSLTGINVVTLFDDKAQPIAERLFFNHHKLSILNNSTVVPQKSEDSLVLNLNFKGLNPETLNSYSVSILPEETKSYKSHNSIISAAFLEPYVKGTIEQARYYFTAIDRKKKLELDNLLLTQGWSSFNWYNIFNIPPKSTYDFEQGISIKANLVPKDKSNGKDKTYILHAQGQEGPKMHNVSANKESFLIENRFPYGDSVLSFSKLTRHHKLKPAQLYLQFFPNTIPTLKDDHPVLGYKPEYQLEESFSNYRSDFSLFNASNVQQLSAVTITSKINNNREQANRLSKGRFGKVRVINEDDLKASHTLINYLLGKGLFVTEIEKSDESTVPGSIEIHSSYGKMNIYLDDMLLYDTSIINHMYLSNVDFVEINKTGLGEGLRGAGATGALRIYTKKDYHITGPSVKNAKTYKIPLAFNLEKKYYVPKYRNTVDAFFKSYGVIDWKPQLSIDKNGTTRIKILKPKVPITLFIEGITDTGTFIFDQKTVSLE
ncbi:MAG: hypothetical protein ABJ218_09205, partial [Winogradskyella arenosi]